MERRNFMKHTAIAAGGILTLPALSFQKAGVNAFPLIDLHVHTTKTFTIEKILEIGERNHVKFGIVEHPTPWALKNDDDLHNYIQNLRKYPVYIGLQPTYLGWRKNYSAELISQVDYILMDPQMVPQGNGETWRIWEFDTYIDDTEDFMKRYMDYSLEVLNNEPINIFGWPLFLPVCIARDYYKLWTEERMQQILTALKDRNIAVEINDMSHTPHAEFILKAKSQGIKFTFGSDSRNENVGRLVYCKQIAEKCNLVENDFYVPVIDGKK
jgi:histidinol phosphatase-like PHP family hydrolase